MSDDFEEQLRLEAEEQKKVQTGEGTYTDSDGTQFEWDPVKKAWFPKIDEDFIAQYQMNYGVTQTTDSSDKSGEQQPAEGSTSKEHEDYWRDYYNYYYHYNQAGSSVKNGKGNKKAETAVDYTSDEYWDYYRYYYDNEGEENDQQNEEKEKEVGATDQEEGSKTEEEKSEESAGQKRKAIEGWFEHDSEKSQHVYVSGLPTDITDDEFNELMSKCGLIMYDPFTHKPKLKLYKDSNKKPKGDGLCCYIKSESVDLALQILDGYYIRDQMITVEKAKFEMKGSFDPNKKKKLNNKQKKKLKEKQEKLFSWLPDEPAAVTRKKHERTVILKHMFDPKEFDFNPAGIVELQDEVRTEAMKFGEVTKVTVHDRHPDGVITLIFKNFDDADKCIASFNGRWFDKRKISAETWDGKTKYHVEESDEERNKRLKQWETFLEKGEAAAKHSEDSVTPVSGRESTTETVLSENADRLSGDVHMEERTESGTEEVINQNHSVSETSDEDLLKESDQTNEAGDRQTADNNNAVDGRALESSMIQNTADGHISENNTVHNENTQSIGDTEAKADV